MSDQPRNVLVIMLDSQRPDVLGCAKDGPAPIADDFARIQTPHVDRIAAEGLFFDRAYAEYPITVPSRTALVSGCYTFTNRPWCPLRPYDFHIAELLREHGFATACWTDTPMGSRANMDRGFDLFDEITVGKCRKQDEEIEVDLMGAAFPDAGGEAEVQYWTNTLRGRHVARRDHGATCPKLLFDKAIQWLEDSPQQPFFAWIDTFDPHEPWCPEPPYDTMYAKPEGGRYIPMPHGPSIEWMSEADLGAVRALYMGDVTRTDAEVGRVMATLADRGIADDTLVVIISDHGEPFGEHDTIRKFGVPIYDELARMVFILNGPGVPQGERSSALVQNVDLAPTLLEMLGLEAPRAGRRVYRRFRTPRGDRDGRDEAYRSPRREAERAFPHVQGSTGADEPPRRATRACRATPPRAVGFLQPMGAGVVLAGSPRGRALDDTAEAHGTATAGGMRLSRPTTAKDLTATDAGWNSDYAQVG